MSAWVQTFLNSESVQTFLTQIKNVQTFSRGADIFYVKDGTVMVGVEGGGGPYPNDCPPFPPAVGVPAAFPSMICCCSIVVNAACPVGVPSIVAGSVPLIVYFIDINICECINSLF